MIRVQGLHIGQVCRDVRLGETAVRHWLALAGTGRCRTTRSAWNRQALDRRASAHPSTRSREQATARRCGYVQKKPRPSLPANCDELATHRAAATQGQRRAGGATLPGAGGQPLRLLRGTQTQADPACSMPSQRAFESCIRRQWWCLRKPSSASGSGLARRRNGPLSRAQFDAPAWLALGVEAQVRTQHRQPTCIADLTQRAGSTVQCDAVQPSVGR